MTAPVRTAALYHLSLGWWPVRVGYRDKVPSPRKDWHHIQHTAATIAAWGNCNGGVRLGEVSGWLTDGDLDCMEAVQLAPHYLPSTWCFGRASKPRSHWLYRCEGANSHQFQDQHDHTLLEIRAQPGEGEGYQTVLPPSIHVSGEPIEWDVDSCNGTDAPRTIEKTELYSRMAKLARATLYMREGATLDEARAKEAAHVPKVREQKTATTRRAAVTMDVIDRARHYLDKMPESISGQGGHKALFRAAIALVRGFDLPEEVALRLLETDFNPRCQPKWDTKDLERKVKHAATRSKRTTGYIVAGG